jgi:Fe-S cluster assembly protein SufD
MANAKRNTTQIDNHEFPGRLRLVQEMLAVSPLQAYRRSAWELAEQLSFPSKKDEAWRWVDLSELNFAELRQVNGSAKAAAFTPDQLKSLTKREKGYSGSLIVSPAGVIRQVDAKAEHAGVIFTDFRTAEKEYPELVAKFAGSVVKPDESKFAAMTAALAEDGFLLYVPTNCRLEKPFLVQILAAAGNHQATFTHTLIWLEAGASADLELAFGSLPAGNTSQAFHSGIVEVHLDDEAVLNLTEIQEFDHQVWNITHERAQVGRNTRLAWLYGALGTHLSKNFVDIDLLGRDAEVQVKGFYLTDDKQHIDLDTQQNHLAARTTSNLLFKGAVTESSAAVWEGMIYVAPTAMQTDGYQSSRNLVLSRSAKVNAIPGLEILADDVRCSHGATVGKIDVEELFYLQARGIPLLDAEQLILEGFFGEVLELTPDEAIKEDLKSKISKKFAEARSRREQTEVG